MSLCDLDKIVFQVLTLSGVARVFNNKRQLIQTLGDFPRAWSLLLEFVENAALSKNNEVSVFFHVIINM